ncbi:hypothetical protein [Microcella pacifica]|uniref:HNH endonuclease n=1 Tax=Microcella pacifica TaxID=2591847 RepID=A0A9E5JKP3_9MICO|nr:hypothetical protein [Microcella pacifica]NHF62258.1 hypothetical protein [Microcella pacifica]
MSEQRWHATVAEHVTEAVLELRDDEEFRARLTAKIDTRNAGEDDCDIWTGAMSSEGYGVIRLPQSRSLVVRAHRVVWMLRFGAVPNDRPFLDHVYPVCRYRFCVNEFHLEPVTNAVNSARRRGTGRTPQRAMRTVALAARDYWAAQAVAA